MHIQSNALKKLYYCPYVETNSLIVNNEANFFINSLIRQKAFLC